MPFLLLLKLHECLQKIREISFIAEFAEIRRLGPNY